MSVAQQSSIGPRYFILLLALSENCKNSYIENRFYKAIYMRDKRGFKYCIEYSDDEVLSTSDDCVEVNKI